MLQVHALSKHFTLHLRGGLQLPVLQEVSLHVEPGECVALLGPSGRGKSTLMKCLYGSYGADSGAIWLNAQAGRIDIASATPQQMLALRRRDIAYVSQFLRAVPRVPAIDIVAERWLQARPELDADEAQEEARDQARALLRRLHLPESLWTLPPATFSGGEQQRVNIARGFIEPSRLLLLDEPTASLDAANRRVVVELIHEKRAAGTAVVGIFHDEEVRDAVASRCVTLH
ncbi:MAG TPA: phosphonate C-P lyase system protein PhnL [Rhizobacter sp.]|nr:phosphonate C-P lyase system protein PhnL [Rhizobacter sp.]